jgi:DNA repair protein RadC
MGLSPFSAAKVLAAYGPEHLADAQLLELLLEEPSLMRATGLLEACGGLGNLLMLGPADLVSLGLTSAEAARVGVLVEVQRRRTRVHRARVCAPGMAWAYLLPKTAGLTEERFGILCLNAKGEVISGPDPGHGHAPGGSDHAA